MSIWCSRQHIGFDPWEDEEPQRGEVRTYAEGFSNHYPTTDDSEELPAAVSLASIPDYCVPGHGDTGTGHAIGPWLRLDITGQGRNHWNKPVTIEEVHASAVLDEDAVRLLVADLQEWLDEPKVRPA